MLSFRQEENGMIFFLLSQRKKKDEARIAHHGNVMYNPESTISPVSLSYA
jgi:hypothetical protein